MYRPRGRRRGSGLPGGGNVSGTSLERQFECLRCVVFDWAGTTVDFGCQAPVQAFVESFAAFGVPVTADEARGPMGMGKRDHIVAMLAMTRIAGQWLDVYGAAPSERDIDRIYQRVESVMTQVIRRHSVPIPGVLGVIDMLRERGLSIGSCTGYPRSVGEQLAERAREYGYCPDVLVCATDVPRSRPEPDMCLKVLADLGIGNPSFAVKIGDTVQDVLEGVRAGMWVVGVTLTGSMAGMTEDELSSLSEIDKWQLHQRISDELTEAGAHFTAIDLPSCVEALYYIDRLCQNKYKP